MSQASAQIEIAIEKSGRTIVARPKTKTLDDAECRSLNQSIDRAATADAEVRVVVVDLSSVEAVPSLGLSVLLRINNNCRTRDQKFKLACIRPNVRQVLSITRLDRVFVLADTVAAAVE